MRVYTTHRRSAGLFADPDLVLVKEGFCWPAFLFTGLWALSHRMWLTALGLFAAGAAIELLSAAVGVGSLVNAALSLGAMLFVGFAANDWRRSSLARRGYIEGPVVAAPDQDAAEWRLIAAETGPA